MNGAIKRNAPIANYCEADSSEDYARAITRLMVSCNNDLIKKK